MKSALCALVVVVLFSSFVLGQAEFCKELRDSCEEEACARACAECSVACFVDESVFPNVYSCASPFTRFSSNDVCPVDVIETFSLTSYTMVFTTEIDSGSAMLSLTVALLFAMLLVVV